jgi:hypothetical protein
VIFLYDDETRVRSISFVNQDGDRKNFFYHNLITHDYNADDETVELYFTSGAYVLKGKNMLLFYKYIRRYRISEIFLIDKRYVETLDLDDEDIAVFSIEEIKK